MCTMHPPRTPQALLEDMKMLEDEFGLAEMATPERDDDPNSLNGDFHDPRDPHDPHTAAARPCAHPPHSTDTLSTLSLSHSPHQAPRGAAGREQLRDPLLYPRLASLAVLDAVRGVRDPKNPYNWLLIQQIVNAKPGVAAMAAVGKMSLLKKVGAPQLRAASPFGDFKLKKSAHPAVMADIAQGSSVTSLKKAETNDKSAPVIDSTVTIGKNKRGELMEAIVNKA